MESGGDRKRPGDCPRCGRFIALATFASGKRLVCESCGYLSLPLTVADEKSCRRAGVPLQPPPWRERPNFPSQNPN